MTHKPDNTISIDQVAFPEIDERKIEINYITVDKNGVVYIVGTIAGVFQSFKARCVVTSETPFTMSITVTTSVASRAWYGIALNHDHSAITFIENDAGSQMNMVVCDASVAALTEVHNVDTGYDSISSMFDLQTDTIPTSDGYKNTVSVGYNVDTSTYDLFWWQADLTTPPVFSRLDITTIHPTYPARDVATVCIDNSGVVYTRPYDLPNTDPVGNIVWKCTPQGATYISSGTIVQTIPTNPIRVHTMIECLRTNGQVWSCEYQFDEPNYLGGELYSTLAAGGSTLEYSRLIVDDCSRFIDVSTPRERYD